MSAESRELVSLREGEYARAAAEAVKFHVEPPEPSRAELDDGILGGVFICRACGNRRHIRPQMHVCMQCFYDLEGER